MAARGNAYASASVSTSACADDRRLCAACGAGAELVAATEAGGAWVHPARPGLVVCGATCAVSLQRAAPRATALACAPRAKVPAWWSSPRLSREDMEEMIENQAWKLAKSEKTLENARDEADLAQAAALNATADLEDCENHVQRLARENATLTQENALLHAGAAAAAENRPPATHPTKGDPGRALREVSR